RWQIRMAAGTLTLLMPLQIWAGHWSGEVAHHHQPAKVAAIEGWWDTAEVQPTILFGWPDEEEETTHFAVAVPGTSDFLFSGSDPLLGLKDFPESERPPVLLVFWAFRFMVAAGLAMLVLGIWGAVLWWRGRIDRPGIFHWLAVPGGALGFIAVVTGWITAEVGRQPYTVYATENVPGLRTEDSLAPVSAGQVATSLLIFMIVYAIVFTAGSVYMARIATRGFGDDPADPPEREHRAPGSPLGSVDDKAEVPATDPQPAE
ncbi:MAG: cytochrome ubiquinol oxidase subunit I, partial [Henriciella sp.]|uniref:cytochrome ubiquinol oxidase subunit I n=1 Tax=Henriciella sp. TaxID=1968823 RepID=UPI003C774C6E